MNGTTPEFRQTEPVSSDGFGQSWRGMTAEGTWRVRALERTDALPHGGGLVLPTHPVVLPLSRPFDEPDRLAAQVGAPTAFELVNRGVRFTPDAALRIIELLGEAIASDEALGPITWHNVHLEPDAPQSVRVFPLRGWREDTAGWLSHPVRDLLFIHRDELRTHRGPRRRAFSLTMLFGVLVKGEGWLPATPQMTSAAFIAQVIGRGHPVDRSPPPEPEPVRRLWRAASEDDNIVGFTRLVGELRRQRGPIGRARAHESAGDILLARKILRDVLVEQPDDWSAALALAVIESRGGRQRKAQQRLRDQRQRTPWSIEALMAIAEVGEGAEAVEALAQLIALQPSSIELRVRYLEARARDGSGLDPTAIRSVLELLERPQAGPGDRLAVARLLAAHVEPRMGLVIAEPWLEADELSWRAAFADFVAAQAFAVRDYALAARACTSAMEALTGLGQVPRAALYETGTYSLIMLGRSTDAREMVLAGVEHHPRDPTLALILSRLPASTDETETG